MDFIPGITSEFDDLNKVAGQDYVIGGVHLINHPAKPELWFIEGRRIETYDEGLRDLFDNDIQLAVKTYWAQIRQIVATQNFDIIAHLHKIKMHNANRYFTENRVWYQHELMETLELIVKKKTDLRSKHQGNLQRSFR